MSDLPARCWGSTSPVQILEVHSVDATTLLITFDRVVFSAVPPRYSSPFFPVNWPTTFGGSGSTQLTLNYGAPHGAAVVVIAGDTTVLDANGIPVEPGSYAVT